MTYPLVFTSAYRSLQPAEKAFVDGYVADVERESERRNERISNALYRPVPPEMIEASRGMLDRPMVRAAITERISALAADSELSPRRVIKELMGIAFGSLEHYMDVTDDGAGGSVLRVNVEKATPEQLAALQSFEIEETFGRNGPTRKIKLKMHDKLAALDRIAKYMGLLEADNPHWRAENARPVGPASLPGSIDTAQAADAYGRMING